jgi:UMP-CMP kinase
LTWQRDSGSPDGEMINSMMVNGELVPGIVTVKLLYKAMQKHGWASKRFLIDGFPRSEENQKFWLSEIGETVDMKFVLFLDCSEEEMIKRITKRGEEAGANRRADDNLETLKKRFNTFREQSLPVIAFYEKLGRVRRVDATKSSE